MHPCDRRHIVLTDGYAGFIVGRIGHVAGPGQRIHDDARGINEVAMNFRHGNPMLEQNLHDVRFALQFGKDRDVSGAISAQVKFNDLAILFDICEPGRTPADLPFHSDDATASDFLHEGPDTRDCVVIVNGCDVCAVAHRNSSPGLDSYWAGHDNPAQHIFGYHIAESAEEAGWPPCRMSALCHPGTTYTGRPPP